MLSLSSLIGTFSSSKKSAVQLQPIHKCQRIQKITLTALLILLVLSLVAMIGAFISTVFTPAGIKVGLILLGVFLTTALLTLFCLCAILKPKAISGKSVTKPEVRPKDLDLTKLDTRYNALLHEKIKEDVKKSEQDSTERATPTGKTRKLKTARPSRKTRIKTPISSSSSDSDSEYHSVSSSDSEYYSARSSSTSSTSSRSRSPSPTPSSSSSSQYASTDSSRISSRSPSPASSTASSLTPPSTPTPVKRRFLILKRHK
ncbi:hypothetical protein [Chlamydia pecorum]|uniref:hypothetical protein n=1 Tax=Chlamydia pecorum TaxID=85991 RepID=UPI000311D706|nr:hypothetical protein [Chlamydia pecorum]UFP07156.1 hypothetical protein KY091_02260 [Chlamydia pecorum]UJT76985.1 hypothetical protein NSWBovSBE_0588 [Chlamydia pecorum]